jgi:nucleoside-diphosphate-sugar epimerase
MRIVVLGGTGFVGRAIVQELTESHHEVFVVHRGTTEPEPDTTAIHVHGAREGFAELWADIRNLKPDGLVDVNAYTRRDAQLVLGSISDELRLLVLSSMDVYRASGVLRGDATQDTVPIDESGALRDSRYIYRDVEHPSDEYEKLDVEDEYLRRHGTVLRLPMIYGEHDDSRREEFILRRCRAGRERIPIGVGNLLWSRGYVRDVASAVRLALAGATAGEIFNVCESRTWTVGRWAKEIALTFGWKGEFVFVPDEALPSDMRLTRSFAQHLLFDASKARRVLGWEDSDRCASLKASVNWHIANPPGSVGEFSTDDAALLRARG